MALKKPTVNPAEFTPPETLKDETAAVPPAADVEEEEEDETAATTGDVADATSGSEVAHTASAASNLVPAENQGANAAGKFAALIGNIKYGTFPQVKLDKDKLVVGEEGEHDVLYFNPLMAQKRWIYKSKDAEAIFFSYNQQMATDGRTVDDHIREWKANGDSLAEVREYMEVIGRAYGGEFDGRMLILSIPPTSTGRLTGIQMELALEMDSKGVPRELDSVILKITAGAKITTAKKKTYHPWSFRIACDKVDADKQEWNFDLAKKA